MSETSLWVMAGLFFLAIAALGGSIEDDCKAGNMGACNYLDSRDWR